MADERINVCYGISDKTGNYAKVMGTSICSVLENTNAPVSVHILHDETLTDGNRRRLKEMARYYGQNFFLHDVSKERQSVWEKIESSISNAIYGEFRFTLGAFYRLLMGELLEGVERAIYLDADTIVNMDIRVLWTVEIPAGGMAAAPDVVVQDMANVAVQRGLANQKEYFNTGVLLIDLEKFRSIDNILSRCMEFLAEYMPEDPDQAFLNYSFPHSSVLPEEYNYFVWKGRREGVPKRGYIYHYVNHSMDSDMEDDFNRLYFSYFAKTPWCDEVFLGNLAKKIEGVNNIYLNFANKCAGRRRIAVGRAAAEGTIAGQFDLRENDLYVPFEKLENFKIDFKKSKDLFLIFLMGQDYDGVKDRLIALGLEENKNFFDMFSLLGISKKNKQGNKLFMDC